MMTCSSMQRNKNAFKENLTQRKFPAIRYLAVANLVTDTVPGLVYSRFTRV